MRANHCAASAPQIRRCAGHDGSSSRCASSSSDATGRQVAALRSPRWPRGTARGRGRSGRPGVHPAAAPGRAPRSAAWRARAFCESASTQLSSSHACNCSASGRSDRRRASQASASAMRSTCSDGGSARSMIVPMRSSTSTAPAPRAQRRASRAWSRSGSQAAQPVVHADAAGEVFARRRHRTARPPPARGGAAAPPARPPPAATPARRREGFRAGDSAARRGSPDGNTANSERSTSVSSASRTAQASSSARRRHRPEPAG